MKHGVRIFSLILGIVVLITVFSSAAKASPSRKCWQDGPGVLSDRTRNYIMEYDLRLERNCSGAQIFICVIGTTGGAAVTDYANEFFKNQSIGNSEEANGILVLFAVDDRDYCIVPGKAYKNDLSTAALTDILRNDIEPFFADGDYDTAARSAFDALKAIVFTHYGADPSGSGSGSSGSGAGRPGGRRGSFFSLFDSCSTGDIIGGVSLAACTACVVSELDQALGGDK